LGEGTLHVRSYCGNSAIHAGKATQLLSYLRNLATYGSKENFMYAITAENPRHEQGRHTLLLSYLILFTTKSEMCERKSLYWRYFKVDFEDALSVFSEDMTI
jgi:hypothetical protein